MSSPRTTAKRLGVVLAGLALIGTSCIFGDDGGDDGSVRVRPEAIESGMPDDPEPTRGGKLVYALEAESNSFCLSEATLAISGMQVLRAFYDPLVVPDAKGGYAPYLAKSVEPNDARTVWTIALRKGVTFNDDARTPLTAAIVRDNLEAYRTSTFFGVVFTPIEKIEVVNELTVKITLDRPWVTFPSALYGGGRIGIMSPGQLAGRGKHTSSASTGDLDDCATQPVGTGPFEFVSWKRGESIQGIRNESYWQTAPDGKPYPYLEAVEFRPMPNSDARIVALQQGEVNMLHTSTAADMDGSLAQLRDAGRINLLISEESTETTYLILNIDNMLSSKPANPILDRTEVRRAIAAAIDREALNDAQNDGFAALANGPFTPGTLGYLEDSGAPDYDPAAAKKVVAKLKAEGASVHLRYLTSGGPASVAVADDVRQMLEAVGFDIEMQIVDEVDVINKVITGDYDISSFRNQPSFDPDSNSHWWTSGTVLNFGGFSDDVIDRSLALGRGETDVDARRQAYELVTKQFGEQQYNIYLWYTPWAVAESSDVHGILGPPLPDNGGAAPKNIVTGHPLIGIWIDRD
ncbi:MAG: hypothetical protein KDG49_03670 [Geminicoccaceae bacterium]|nr:hypothetical protein [Geminicoccaceae bacterium]